MSTDYFDDVEMDFAVLDFILAAVLRLMVPFRSILSTSELSALRLFESSV